MADGDPLPVIGHSSWGIGSIPRQGNRLRMKLLLANPAGLWALLAIPAVLLIHFLQERSRRVRVSTLFLLERVKPESVGGARFERLRHSVPLWLQLIAAVLLAWMLSEPRWIREDSRQTIVVVLDSSVSMSAFKEETRALVAKKLAEWSRTAAHTEWHLLESDVRKPTLYSGLELRRLIDAYDKWEPLLGTHRPDDVLLTARGLVKENGIVIFVTDRKTEVPSDVALLSAGEDVGNVGFTGVEVKLTDETAGAKAGMKWRALVRNHGTERVERTWRMELPEGKGAPRDASIQISPGQTMALHGELPPDVERATLVLDGDRFTADDRLPLHKPQARVAVAEIRVGGASGETVRKMIGASQHVSLRQESSAAVDAKVGRPDVTVSEIGTPVNGNAIQFVVNTGELPPLDPAWTLAENHRLTRDLNWMGLLTPRPLELTLTENDEALLWKGERLLALVRHERMDDSTPTQRLLLGWDLSQSNAARHPAVLVMLHRFIQMVRESKRDAWADNFETGQAVEVAGSQVIPAGTQAPAPIRLELRMDGDAPVPFEGRVPERVGFFEVIGDGSTLLRGATHFADAREADFSDAARVDNVDQRRWEAALKQTEADPWMPLWMLLLLGCLITAWVWRTGVRHGPSRGLEPLPGNLKSIAAG
jgi:hypothetical protein